MQRLKILSTLLLFLVHWCYFLINRFREASFLLTTSVDQYIPYIPLFGVVYLSYIPFILFNIWWAFNYLEPTKYLNLIKGMILIHLIGYGFHLGIPATIQRPHLQVDGLLNLVVDHIYSYDCPSNQTPSLHVACSTFLAYSYHLMSEKTINKILIYLWASLICVSTLVIKQHYFIDLITGWVLAGGAGLLLYLRNRNVYFPDTSL